MNRYVDATEQLVVEIYVRDIERSRDFLEAFGFDVIRDEGDFIELKWDQSRLFLEQIHGAPAAPAEPVANLRIMVPNVDDYWARAQKFGTRIVRPIEDRYYGLRDFTIAGPDGIALRFTTLLKDIK